MHLSSRCLLVVVAALFLVDAGARADLIAYYTFDDGDATDEAEGNDGIPEGDAVPDGPGVGPDGEAYRFSGQGHIVVPIDISPAIYPQLTVTMWVKADENVPTSPALYKTFGHDDGGWDRTFGLDNRNGPFRWAAFNGSAPGPTQTTGTPVTSEWTFLAAVWDTDADGGPMVRFHANENYIVEPLVDTFSSHTTCAIGNLRPDNFSEGWRGLIDEVQIYDEALEVEDIEEIFAQVPPPNAAPPEATTRRATGFADGTASIQGAVNPNGLDTVAWFEYGPTTNYGNMTPEVDVGNSFGGQPVSATLTGLDVGATYHFRVVGRNSLGTAAGDDATFVVPEPGVPIAYYSFDGGGPEDDSGNGNDGVIEGDATPFSPGVKEDDEAFQFLGAGHIVIPIDINPTVYPDLTVTMWVKADEVLAQSPGLYKTFGHDDGGWDRTFGLDNRNGPFRWAAFTGAGITGPTPTPVTPEWTFLAAVWDSHDDGTASIRFHADAEYIEEPLTTTPSGHTTCAVGNLRPDNFNEGWQGLIDEVKIFPAALSVDEVEDVRNEVADDQTDTPAATTLPPGDLGPGFAVLRGSVVPNGSATTARFEYGPTTAYGMNTPEVDAGNGFATFQLSASVAGLNLLEMYHYRVVATNALGTSFGEDVSFEVPESRPLLAHYTFEGGEAEDVSGNDNTGVVEGDALPADSDRDGDEDGEAFQFFGAGHIVIPIDINPTVQPDLTVTMWAKPDQLLVDAPNLYKTFGHDDGGWDRTFGLDNRNGNYRWCAFTGAGITADAGTPVTSEWTFLAAVWDTEPGGGATIRFHADDLHITETLTNTPSGHITAAIGNLRPDNFNEGFQGLIDDVRVYAAALSIDEIEDIREGVTEPTGSLLIPGNANGDGSYNISDPVAHLNFLFASGALPGCYVVAGSDPVELTAAGLAILDFNGDGSNNIADAVSSLNFLFGGGTPPALGEDCASVQAEGCADQCQ